MAYDVKFVKGLADSYAALETKDSGTLYFITDQPAIYLGSTKLTSVQELAAAVTRLTTDEGAIGTLESALSGIDISSAGSVKACVDAVEAKIGSLASLETDAKSTAVAAINELKTSISNLSTASTITLTKETTAAEGMASTYTLTQGSTTIGTINIPKDLVVESGSVVVASVEEPINGATSGTFIELVIQNQEEPIYIAASDLIDVYEGAANATSVQITVSGYTISATVVDGAITVDKLAANSVTTSKIVDGNVTADKLAADSVTTAKIEDGAVTTAKLNDSAVTEAKLGTGSVTTDKIDASAVTTAKIADESITNTKLDSDLKSVVSKANSAVQSVTEGSTDGTVSVDGTDVAVHGLGSAAYTASTAYDAAGAATAVQTALTGTASDSASTLTLNGLSAAVDEAESNAKAYTDTALTWGSFSA